MMCQRRLQGTIAAALLAVAIPSAASADSFQHSQHLDLVPVADAPLRTGFVENIHSQGPKNYAREAYVLNGATPDATFDVALLVHPFDPACQGPTGVVIETGSVHTNPAGNGQAGQTITPEDVTGFPRGTHGVVWSLSDTAGTPTYATACTAVTLD